jgi:hypothetical protein
MQTESISSEKSSAAKSGDKDPVLLGVSLPISATVHAATQVKDAWLEAITAVVAAARAKANETKAAVAKKTNGAAKAVESEINA